MSTPPNDKRSPKKWLKKKLRSVFTSKSQNRNFDVPDALPTLSGPTSANDQAINTSFVAAQARGESPFDGPPVIADRTESGE